MMYNNRSARSSRKLVACALVVIGLLGGLVLIGCGSSGSSGSNGPPTATPLEFSYELLGDDLTVNVMVSSGTTIDADIMVTITLTPEGGEALTGTVTVDQATGSGTITFMGASTGNYELMASSSASIRVVSDTDFELLQTLQLSTADTDYSMTRSGDFRFSLPLVMPARDAYKISLVDTGDATQSATTLGSALAISDPDGTDQGSSGSRRLYRDADGTKTLGATVPTGFTDGLIYAFLPGDDGADAPDPGAKDSSTYYELIWRQNDNTTAVPYPSQLAAATEYTLTITAAGTVNWRLRIELHDLPRLPANIATTFRGPRDGGNEVTGTNGAGEGFYLVYNPTVGDSSISMRLERAAVNTSLGTFLAGSTSTILPYAGDQNGCSVSRMGTLITYQVSSSTPKVVIETGAIDAIDQSVELMAPLNQPIYCVEFQGTEKPIANVVGAITASSSRPNNDFGRRSGHFVFTLLSEQVSSE